MATSAAEAGDKYRSYLTEEDLKNTSWRFGPPNYDVVNKLFEEGRTQKWPEGSVEEKVQRLLKTWEMELVHKANPDEYKTLDAKNFTISINGRKPLTLEGIVKIGGGYNLFLQTGLPEKFRVYDPATETKETSMQIFTSTFPRGFAIEILRVYSGPPSIVYKFRHWAYMEGAFKGHAPTGELVEFFGTGVFEVDEQSNKIVKVQFFYDPKQLLEGLVKGDKIGDELKATASSTCPFMAASK
ncbi:OLC1v1016628C5 [Oldenlandia corymbosa var. corymbosa]|uniref:OLC1v1016628C5 n=1 Tax=Oldenlandia corymbosa var. corymbosa TaxID=529605 RepID=A0AAV1E6H7_OLDCO|nr:OLC1v1016628C5 [Oldenlandia corymbosa var. corymbosa]